MTWIRYSPKFPRSAPPATPVPTPVSSLDCLRGIYLLTEPLCFGGRKGVRVCVRRGEEVLSLEGGGEIFDLMFQ